ncbi:MAG: cyanophycin synthetase [Candidatus Liptonbacteria bacterium]|nr:cyanophycin synthetase [Candidatus Liptonbacteria bacterium]
MRRNYQTPLLGKVLQKIAPKIGARVVLEPEWNIVGQIIFKNGRKRYFRYSSLDLNPLGASDIAKDKDYANFFMRRMGYPVIPGRAFFSYDWCKAIGSRRDIDAAYRYAKTIGFPVVVKPNSGSQGTNVAYAYNRVEFFRAVRAVFVRDRVALVQKPVRGTDYRVVVLDGRVISAYERIPLHVVGDGKHTIRQLLQVKQRRFVAASRDTRIKMHDPRIALKLARQGLTFRSVPPKGARIYLLDNANLSTGGDSVDVTKNVHPAFHRIAVRLTRDMGLRLCGVDLMVKGSITEKLHEYWVLEVNAAPGLDHYAATGRAQERIVEELYLEVLKSMAR